MYERLTRTGLLTVFVAFGDAQNMEVHTYYYYSEGKKGPVTHGTLDDLKQEIKVWVKKQPLLAHPF
jgi:hypothetical protein